ncbi:hypothetical protein, partial [Rothia nasimurium]|uniref:hypothetical protein n=1 Tax=Rothia nasimurium TaxID=85336 RepID=UPI0035585AAD
VNLTVPGGWIIGGDRKIVLGDSLLLSQGEGSYTWAGNLIVEDSYVILNDESAFYDNSSSKEAGIYFDVSFISGEWRINGVHDVEISE